MIVFDSKIEEIGRFAEEISDENIVKNEPMFFNSSILFAFINGGPITRSFLSNLPYDWRVKYLDSRVSGDDFVFDSRVHMLMPGWYPCIPGFHHDDVPRSGVNGQPNYVNPEYYSEHIIGVVNAHICPTEFAIGENVKFNPVPEGELVYRQWHQECVDKIESGEMESVMVPDRTLVQFDWQTFHQGTQAVQFGWRWFGRISRKTDRTKQITNEIRRQVNVYLEKPMEGW